MGNAVEITDDNFKEQVLDSDIPVLVDFWAIWCGPCKMIAPIVEELAVEKSGLLKVGKVDVDSYKVVAGQYGIRSIPTLLLFKNGQVVEQIVGALSKSQLVEKIEPHL
ncbi:thioredoxin [candidate division KSB1 bacterium]|nr:thioredoxin [candidate division KSB1 bacterium]